MPVPVEICVEDLDRAEDDERYLRCVALPGGEPGLALDSEGAVRWMAEGPGQYGLWVSADDRLVLLRGAGTGPAVVSRAGRSVEAPLSRPVVLRDQDLLLLGGRRLRIHIHGATETVQAPERLSLGALGRIARTATTALALGAAVGVVGADAAAAPGSAPIEVRARPPAPRPAPQVICTITRMGRSAKQGPLMVHATCPAPTPAGRVTVGARGYILDPKTNGVIPNGDVVVTKVSGSKIVAESKLTKPVKATRLRVFVRQVGPDL